MGDMLKKAYYDSMLDCPEKPMTSKLKCPFCGERLFVGGAFLDTQYAKCTNPGCKQSIGVMPVEIWQTIIDGKKAQKDLKNARKALGVAVDALKEIKEGKTPVSLGIGMDINDALDKITALTKGGNNE